MAYKVGRMGGGKKLETSRVTEKETLVPIHVCIVVDCRLVFQLGLKVDHG